MDKLLTSDYRMHPWLNLKFLEASSVTAILERLRAEIRQVRRPAVVLDLDSTLFCVNPRSRSIFAAFLREHESPENLWQRVHHHWNEGHHVYSIRETIENVMRDLGEVESLPRSYEVWKRFEPYWMEHFFSSRHMDQDRPYNGALDFVRSLFQTGAELIYLTGRDRLSSSEGTLRTLKAHGFPQGENTRLILKPGGRDSMSDELFKQRASELIAQQYDVLLSIDNEPENLLPMAKYFPRAQIVWMLTVMSKRVPDAEKLKRYLAGRPLYSLKNF
jgi:hypothetical protein